MQTLLNKSQSIEYLGYQQFAATFVLAVALHLLAWLAWYMSPHMRVIDIPVRAINIRLGDSDVRQQVAEDETAPQPELNTSKQVEDAMTKLIRNTSNTPKPAKKVSTPRPKVSEATEKAAPTNHISSSDIADTPRQFVRFKENAEENTPGSALGNSTDSTAQVKARYEQTISLWIQKFKIYPESAKALGIRGKAVVRIRIDRRGNIRYSSLESTTESADLDRAALDMVRRANPVPAVPESYVAGEMFEFLIPVTFGIK